MIYKKWLNKLTDINLIKARAKSKVLQNVSQGLTFLHGFSSYQKKDEDRSATLKTINEQ